MLPAERTEIAHQYEIQLARWDNQRQLFLNFLMRLYCSLRFPQRWHGGSNNDSISLNHS